MQAQSDCLDLTLPGEQVVMHLDRNVYLAGETIWFKAWCLVNGQLGQDLSKVLYVEIFDENQNTIIQKKFPLKENISSGSMTIPADVQSRNYYLRAYTRYMRNFSPEKYHYQQIIIVNPLIENGTFQSHTQDLSLSEKSLENQDLKYDAKATHLLNLELDSDVYPSRQKVSLDISNGSSEQVNVAISVRLKDIGNHPRTNLIRNNPWLMSSCLEDPLCRQEVAFIQNTELQSVSNRQDESLRSDLDDLEWLPETRGLTISGVVLNDKNEKVKSLLSLCGGLILPT